MTVGLTGGLAAATAPSTGSTGSSTASTDGSSAGPWSPPPRAPWPGPSPGPVTASRPKAPVAVGTGGAVASVDDVASEVGLDVLARGGNAADAAIATAAALGVTEPYSAGIGGGGFLVHHDGATGEVTTLDGRETAPAAFTERSLLAADGTPLPTADVVSSGLSVGVPGTPALWDRAARDLGTRPLRALLAPAARIAERGFVVDATFAQQTADNAARFARFPATAEVYLPGGAVPAVGDVFRNPDLARSYRALAAGGVEELYGGGRLGRAVLAASTAPATAPGVQVLGGQLTPADLAAYDVLEKDPVVSHYRGLEVHGMPVPSSGGIAVGEALNLLEAYDALSGQGLPDVDQVQHLHRFAEATATAFADRNRWVGDVPGVPAAELLSQGFADERACQVFDPGAAAPRPIPFGSPDGSYDCAGAPGATAATADDHGTTHLTVADRWGDVVSYTLTIEATGGSGITVPGYGFLLNNELTDFNALPVTAGVPDPNLPGPGKRPRSSMAPTIVLRDGKPVLALGSPGGATIITTVAQVLVGDVDRHLPLVEAIAAPRISSRNAASTPAEPAIADGPEGAGLRALGHALTTTPEIGAATAIAIRGDGTFEAAAETTRRGGGSAVVLRPQPPG